MVGSGLPEPIWPNIHGSLADCRMNLSKYINMENVSDDNYGGIFTLPQFIDWSRRISGLSNPT